eukprot:TRINITY_DN7928_c0_g1_i2.p1 TRINITY_DN7928_c0_g1~~TRINITY_DN7928_c0_g1_i2.p1  ORF type:complete len:245 (+),score=45.68 TRINITY_DN7928_c0_g1_i2:140-874(+)
MEVSCGDAVSMSGFDLDGFPQEGRKEGTYSGLLVKVLPEIRKGYLWDVTCFLDDFLLTTYYIPSVLIQFGSFQEVKHSLDEHTFYIFLKVRSKLIDPVREEPMKRVAKLADEPLCHVYNGKVVFKVKFTERPRNVFHRHRDIMILYASLYRGTELLDENSTELIFRGGTGSKHSNQKQMKQVIPSPPPYTMEPALAFTPISYSYFHPQEETILYPPSSSIPPPDSLIFTNIHPTEDGTQVTPFL